MLNSVSDHVFLNPVCCAKNLSPQKGFMRKMTLKKTLLTLTTLTNFFKGCVLFLIICLIVKITSLALLDT